MIKKILDLLYKYESENRLADENFVYDAITIIMRYENLYDYIKEVNIMPANKDSIGNYNTTRKILQVAINSTDDLFELFDRLTDHSEIKSPTLINNIEILSNIFHETDHALIQRQYESGEDDIMLKLFQLSDVHTMYWNGLKDLDFLYKSMRLAKKMEHLYHKHHDYCPFETRAIMTSYHLVFDLLRELYKTDIKKEYILYILYSYRTLYEADIIHRYKETRNGVTRSASYDYCNKLRFLRDEYPEELRLYNKNKEQSYLNDSNNYSLKERIEYGLQLSSEELESVLGKDIYNAFYKRLIKLPIYMK